MKNLFCIVLMLTASFSGWAQTAPEFQVGAQFTREGITFKVSKQFDFFTMTDITNVANVLEDGLFYQDGRKVEYNDYGKIKCEQNPADLKRAIKETFSREELETLNKNQGRIYPYFFISPQGKLLEVGFTVKDSTLPYLKPEHFARLERNLKKYMRFTLNDFTRQLKYTTGPLFLNFKTWDFTDDEPEANSLGQQIDNDPTVGNDGELRTAL